MTAQKLFLHFKYLNKTGETLESVSALKFLYEREPIIPILAWTYTASCSYEYISCIYIYIYILYVRSKYKLYCRYTLSTFLPRNRDGFITKQEMLQTTKKLTEKQVKATSAQAFHACCQLRCICAWCWQCVSSRFLFCQPLQK